MVLRIILLYLIALYFSVGVAKAQATDDAHSLNLKGQELLDNGQYRQARDLFRQSIELCAHDGPSLEQAKSLSGYAEAITTSDFVQADSLYSKSLAILLATSGKNSEYAQTLQNLAEVRIHLQRYDGVEDMIKQVLKIKAKRYGTKSMEYADALSVMGWYYANRSDFSQSEQAFGTALKIAREKAPDSYGYGKILHKAFFLYFNRQDFATAENHCRQAIAIYEKTRTTSDRKLIEAKGCLALLYIRTERVGQGEKMIVGLLPLIEREYGKEDYTYSVLLMTLGSVHASYGWQEKAIAAFEESMSLNKRLFGERHDSHFNALNNLSIIYMRTDRLEQAEELLTQSLKIRKDIYGESNSAYIQGLNNLAVLYQKMGHDSRAADMLREVAERSKVLLGESSKSHILALYNLALCSRKNKLDEEALAFTDMIEDILTRYDIADRPEFIEIRANSQLIAMRSSEPGPEMGQKLKQLAATLLSSYGEQNTTYHNMINGLSTYYLENGDYKSGLPYTIQYCELIEKYLGKETTTYLWAICNKSGAYYRLNRWAEAEIALTECLDITKKLTQKNFPFMTASQREEYWVFIRRSLSFVEDFVLFATQGRYNSPRLRELVYNSNLFARALLLNYRANTQKSIMESNDPELISLWQQLGKLKENQGKDSEQTEHLEKQLALRSKAYRSLQNDLSIEWQDVRDHLSEGEAAVEITTLAVDLYNPTLKYVGLIVRPGDKSPRMVMLGNKEELKAILKHSPYGDKNLYRVFFKPLEKHLDGVKRIYMAAGELANKVSFVGMKQDEGYLLDKYSICTLLSTKDIARVKQFEQPFTDSCSIVLFGGADFGLSPAELAESESQVYKSRKPDVIATLSDRIDLSRGQGFDYLPGSKKEVTQIGNRLSACGWKTAVHTDLQAVESRFKALSSIPVDVIHISTHGYYFPFRNTEDPQPTDNMFKISDDPLIRSGLLFSGANRIWNSGSRVDSMEDGVLTGYEISLMDLSQTRLVVLSACNTAHGDIDFREGIYGLQRAFRMAGAGAVLVSLWEIPDKETAIFMEAFYEQLTGGVSIRDAFVTTMRKMKKDYPENPKVWAGFVLME